MVAPVPYGLTGLRRTPGINPMGGQGLQYQPMNPLRSTFAGGLQGLGNLLMAYGAGQPQQALPAFQAGLQGQQEAEERRRQVARDEELFGLKRQELSDAAQERQDEKAAEQESAAAFDAAVDGLVAKGVIDAAQGQAMKAGVVKYGDVVQEPEKPTDDIREYNLYVEQGGTENFTDWMRGNKKAGASSTSVNVSMPKSVLAGDQKMLEIGAEGFMQAQEILPLFGIAKTAAENFSQSGPMGGAALFLERAKNYMGMDNNASAGEVLQGMQTRLGTLLRVPGSGATSNMEMSLYMQGVPGLLNSQQGNIALATIGEKLTRRRMENFQKLQAYVAQNGTTVGYVPDDTPTLTQQEVQVLQGAANAGGGTDDPGAPTATGPNGEKLILRNGQWERM